jgi:hypothetical protein
MFYIVKGRSGINLALLDNYEEAKKMKEEGDKVNGEKMRIEHWELNGAHVQTEY